MQRFQEVLEPEWYQLLLKILRAPHAALQAYLGQSRLRERERATVQNLQEVLEPEWYQLCLKVLRALLAAL